MVPVAINTVPIRFMDFAVHQDAIVSARIATISMTVTRLEEVYFFIIIKTARYY